VEAGCFRNYAVRHWEPEVKDDPGRLHCEGRGEVFYLSLLLEGCRMKSRFFDLPTADDFENLIKLNISDEFEKKSTFPSTLAERLFPVDAAYDTAFNGLLDFCFRSTVRVGYFRQNVDVVHAEHFRDCFRTETTTETDFLVNTRFS
jgi:hypothetical protein